MKALIQWAIGLGALGYIGLIGLVSRADAESTAR
jgi:hypothetical protein